MRSVTTVEQATEYLLVGMFNLGAPARVNAMQYTWPFPSERASIFEERNGCASPIKPGPWHFMQVIQP